MKKNKLTLIKEAVDNHDLIQINDNETLNMKFNFLSRTKNKEEFEFFENFLAYLTDNDEIFRKNYIGSTDPKTNDYKLIDDEGKKYQKGKYHKNYRITTSYLDSESYKNNYSLSSLFSDSFSLEEWEKLSKNNNGSNGMQLFVVEPNTKYKLDVNNPNEEFLIKKMKSTFGILSQGDQYTIVELNPNLRRVKIKKNINGKSKEVVEFYPRYTISKVLETFKKPKEFLDSDDLGLAFTKSGKIKITQPIMTIDNNGRKGFNNADYYELMRNFFMGAISAINGNYQDKQLKLEHISRIASVNLENIDAVGSVAFFNGQARMKTLGMSLKSYYNSQSTKIIFDNNMFDPYLKNMYINVNNNDYVLNSIYKSFNVSTNEAKQIINEIFNERHNFENIFGITDNKIFIETSEFINEYKKRVVQKLHNDSSYYLVDTDKFDVNLNFSNPNYSLYFNANKHFESNLISDKRLIENYLFKNNFFANTVFENDYIDLKTFNKYLERNSFSQKEIFFKDNSKIKINDMFNYISRNHSNFTSEELFNFANVFKKYYDDKISRQFGFSSFEEVLSSNLINSDLKKEILNYSSKLSANFIYGTISNGDPLSNLLEVGKQSANIRSKLLNISQSFADIFGHLNIAGQRASQGGDKFSGAYLHLDNGISLDFARIISSWQKYDKVFDTKVLNSNVEFLEDKVEKIYKTSTGTNDVKLNLFSKYGSILYTDSDYAFQDSNIISNISAMKNISMYDNKSMFISYDSINNNVIKDLVDKFDLNSASGFYERLNTIDKSKIIEEGSFENELYKKILGNNFKKYIEARYNEDGTIKNIADEFNFIGNEISKITSVQTIEDKKKLIKSVDESVEKYNDFINRYFIPSDSSGKKVHLVNKDFLQNGYNSGITGSNFGFIEDIIFEHNGIRLKSKGIVLASQGTKMMYDNIKATNQSSTNMLALIHNGYTSIIDAIVNEKMTKGKRGFNGTFYGRSILTMALHGLTQDFSDNLNLTPEEKFHRFFNIMTKNSEININGNTTNVFDLLGLKLSYFNGQLTIGERDKITKEFRDRLFSYNDLNSAFSYLKNQMDNRIESLIGEIPNINNAENIGELIKTKLYDAYEVYLSQLTENSRNEATIYIPNGNSYLEKSTVNIVNGIKEYNINKIHDIGTQGAYRFFSFTHMMKESKARETEEALKFTRLTNIVFAENGLLWLGDEMTNAIASKHSSKLVSEISLLPNNIIEKLFPGKDIAEIADKTFNGNILDLNNANYEKTNNGYRFLNETTIGKMLDYNYDEGKLNESLYAKLTNFDKRIINELKDFSNFLDNKDNITNLSIKYLAASIHSNDINNILNNKNISYENKLKEIDKLLKNKSSILKKHMSDIIYTNENGDYVSLLNKDIRTKIRELYGNKIDIQDSVIDNFVNFFNQFNVNRKDLLNSDFANVEFKFNQNEQRILNKVFQTLFPNNKMNFAQMLNQYSGENLIKFETLKEIAENGYMKFKISDFSITEKGDIVFNSELNAINNIIKGNAEFKELVDAKDIFTETKFKPLFKSKDEVEQLQHLIKSKTELNNIEFHNFLATQFAFLNNDTDIEEFNKFQNNIKKIKDNLYLLNNSEDKKAEVIANIEKNYKEVQSYIRKVIKTSDSSEYTKMFENEISKVNLILNDSTKIKALKMIDLDYFIDNILNESSFRKIDKRTAKNSIYSINVKQLFSGINLNTKDNKLIFTSSSEIANSILNIDNKLTLNGSSDNLLNEFFDIFYEKGKLKENISYYDFGRAIQSLKNNLNLIENNSSKESDVTILKNFIYKSEMYLKESFINNYIKNNTDGNSQIILYDKIYKAISDTYNRRINNIVFNIANNITKYSPETQLLEKYTYFQPKHASAIYAGEGTAINYYIKNELNEIFQMDKTTSSYAKKKDDFIKAMTSIYGDFKEETIKKIIDNGDIKILEKFLNSQSGIVLGSKESYEKAGLINLFEGKKYTYGFLSRNPHQYVGSIRASRLVMIDETNRDLSFIGKFIGSENIINNTSPSFSFIGKRTAIGMNGDFDGDQYQLFKYSDEDFKYYNKKIREKILKKINYDNEIGYLLNDLSVYDLKTILNNNKLDGSFKRLDYLIKQRAKLDDDYNKKTFNSYKYIEDRYKALKFEYLRANEVVKDEINQHSELPSLKKMVFEFNGNNKSMNKDEFLEFILSLSEKEKSELSYKLLSENELNDFGMIFDLKNSNNIEINKKIEEFNKLDFESKRMKSYAFLKELNKEITKGTLKFNNVWLADTGYEAYTGIHRTGPVHSLLTSFRETGTIATQTNIFNGIANNFIKNNNTFLTKDEINRNFKTISEFASKSIYYNTFGTMIEKLSISSKLGGGADPYINMTKLRNAEKIISNFSDPSKIHKVFNFNELTNLIESLSDQMEGKEFIYNNKKIQSANDIVNSFIKSDFIKKDKDLINEVNRIKNSLVEVIAVLTNNSLDSDSFSTINLGIDNRELLSIFSNLGLISSKSFLSNTIGVEIDQTKEYKDAISKSYDVYDGLRKKIKDKGLIYNLIKFFNPNNKDVGLRFETSFIDKFKEKIIDKFNFKKDAIEKEILESNVVEEVEQQISKTKENIKKINELIQELENNNNNKNVEQLELFNTELKKEYSNVDPIINEVIPVTNGQIDNSKNFKLNFSEDIPVQHTDNIELEEAKKRIQQLNETINDLTNKLNSYDSKIGDIKQINEAEIEKLKKELEIYKLKEDSYNQMKTEYSNAKKILDESQTVFDENEAKLRIELDKKNQLIESLRIDNDKKIKELNNTIEKLQAVLKNKEDNLNSNFKIISELKENLKKLIDENQILSEKNKTLNNSIKNSSNISDNANEIKSFLGKNKKMFAIGGAVATIGLFFRIFQSNRSVVELDINQEQYEETKGSLYRTLGNYNINTNIRSFY